MRKPKIAYLQGQLIQGGAERYTYELLSKSDRDRFDVTLIVPTTAATQHYYPLLRASGIEIILAFPERPLIEEADVEAFRLVLEPFDLVVIIQIENYQHVQPAVNHRRLVIHLMSTMQQYFPEDPYRCLVPHIRYNLVSGNPLQLDEIKHPLKHYFRWFYMPLTIEFGDKTDTPAITSTKAHDTIRVATVTRISLEKPLEPFLIAFHCMLKKYPNAQLYIYGSGDIQSYRRIINILKIGDNIVLRGHQMNLELSILQDEIAIVLCECFGDGLGYSAIQLGGQAIPIAFWDTAPNYSPTGATGFTRFSHLPAYTDQICRWLDDPVALHDYRLALRDYVRRMHGHPGRIRALEDFYQELIVDADATANEEEPTSFKMPPELDTPDALSALGGPIVIYGTGAAGKQIFAMTKDLNIEVLAFARSEGEGIFEGLPVVPLPELPQRFGVATKVVIASQFYVPIACGLARAGFQYQYNALPLLMKSASGT